MSIIFHALCERSKEAARQRWRLANALENADRRVATSRDAVKAESLKRKINLDDEGAVEAALERAGGRLVVDASLRVVTTGSAKTWIRVEMDNEPFADEYCGETLTCPFRHGADRRRDFKGYAESIHNEGRTEGRRCFMCLDRVLLRERLFVIEQRKLHGRCMSAEGLLAKEAKEEPYAAETLDARWERLQFVDEWRAPTLAHVFCSVCRGDSALASVLLAIDPKVALCDKIAPDHDDSVVNVHNAEWMPIAEFRQCIECADGTPATHLLVGCPSLRLCAAHFEKRDSLKRTLLTHTPPKLRGGRPPCARRAAAAVVEPDSPDALFTNSPIALIKEEPQ